MLEEFEVKEEKSKRNAVTVAVAIDTNEEVEIRPVLAESRIPRIGVTKYHLLHTKGQLRL